VLAVLLAVGVGGYTWFRGWARPIDIASNNPTRQTQQPSDSGGDIAGATPGVEGVAPELTGDNRKEGVYTFLVSGLDREGLHTDTNIVGMFDTVNGELNLVNIPRDTLINIPFSIKKMNQPYPAAINNNEDATEALLDAVEKLLGYRVDCYAIVDIKAVEEIVDAIGGVWYDIPFDMDWDAPDQTPEVHIHIKAGYQLLDGENFVNAMRFRMSNDGSQDYAGGDMERIAFQQKLLFALAEQTISLGNIPNLSKIFNIYERRVETEVSVGNLAYFAQEFLKMDMSNINFMTIPNKPDAVIYGQWYVTVYIDQWVEMINEYLNPFTIELTRDNLDMISFDGANWDTTQGYIAGGDYSFLGAQA
ncbi:MAG: LCP family protein, partial [Oscillospiraceae bacterium]|nr:LCP family protein [Oscillospiraceae bacterium]